MEERQGEGEDAARPLTRRELRRLAALADGPERAETGMATDESTSRSGEEPPEAEGPGGEPGTVGEPGTEAEPEPWVAAVGTEHVPVDVVWPSGDEQPAEGDVPAPDDDSYRTVVLPRPPVEEDAPDGLGHDEPAADQHVTTEDDEAASAPVRISVLGDVPAPGQGAPWPGAPVPWSNVGGSRPSARPFAPVNPDDATAEQPAVRAAAAPIDADDVPAGADEAYDDAAYEAEPRADDGGPDEPGAFDGGPDEPEDYDGGPEGPEAYDDAAYEPAVFEPEVFEPEVYGSSETAREDVGEQDRAAVPPAPAPGPWVATAAGAVPAGAAAAAAPARSEALPTLTDLLSTRPEPRTGPAELGWRAAVRRLTGGLVAPAPGPAEVAQRESVASVQRTFDGPRTVVVINPKGGAHKTTTALLIAATFGTHRGGYTLAWDNNETRGTMGWRSRHAEHQNTAVNLLQDLERFADPGTARVGDLDRYVRSQGTANFDVLASDEDAASAASIDAFAFKALHRTLARFYRVMVVDTGNNMRASNWQAAVEAADQVVIVSTVREDTAQSAAWAVDALRATGHDDVVRNAVTVLADPAVRRDPELARRLHDHFGKLTRAVVDVPYDPALVGGGPIDFESLSAESRTAWLRVTAAVADGL